MKLYRSGAYDCMERRIFIEEHLLIWNSIICLLEKLIAILWEKV